MMIGTKSSMGVLSFQKDISRKTEIPVKANMLKYRIIDIFLIIMNILLILSKFF